MDFGSGDTKTWLPVVKRDDYIVFCRRDGVHAWHCNSLLVNDTQILDIKEGCCDVCDEHDAKSAVEENGVKICHECLEFFKSLSRLNNRDWNEEVSFQTEYIKNHL